VKRRGSLYVANGDDQLKSLAAFAAQPDVGGAIRTITPGQALALCPILRPDYVHAAVLEPDACDVDVHALHQGFLRLFKQRGGVLATDADVQRLSHDKAQWHAVTSAGDFRASVVINAAGAWADTVAALAGLSSQKIQPCRRTAVLAELPGLNPESWPMTIDIDETFYFKPDAGLLLLSPADETPVAPCDVQPEELDIALAIDRTEQATTLKITRLRRKWAGLRSFAPDRLPVIGFDADCSNFFWLAGQGGYGIQTAPGAAQLAAALVRGGPLPKELDGFDPLTVSPRSTLIGTNNG
jgi:D-arginine dehydrogenase